MRKNKLKAVEAAMLIALCAALCVGTWAQGRQNAISGQLVRLHVIAASDDAREQALKLRVRDAVLEYLTPLLDGADGSAEAKRRISENLDGIARAAAERAEGRGVTVTSVTASSVVATATTGHPVCHVAPAKMASEMTSASPTTTMVVPGPAPASSAAKSSCQRGLS